MGCKVDAILRNGFWQLAGAHTVASPEDVVLCRCPLRRKRGFRCIWKETICQFVGVCWFDGEDCLVPVEPTANRFRNRYMRRLPGSSLYIIHRTLCEWQTTRQALLL